MSVTRYDRYKNEFVLECGDGKVIDIMTILVHCYEDHVDLMQNRSIQCLLIVVWILFL